jgi:hypothetical protein
MLKFTFAALLALSVMTVADFAFACPSGYAACGETGQLCCPVN